MTSHHKTLWIPSLMAAALLVAAPAYAESDQDIEAWRRGAQEALRQAHAAGADQWTHTDMVLAEESYRIGNYPLAKERADTAREKTLALKNVPTLTSRMSVIESTASSALATAQRAEAKADRAEANSQNALEQARQAERMAKEASERVPASTSTIRESTSSSSAVPGTPGSPRSAQDSPLGDVFFDYDSSVIRPDGRDALLSNAHRLRANPDVTLTIEGHADERGTTEYNLGLGQRRAQAARDVLVAAGVAPDRISIVSYGKERPFVIGHDESAWRSNRRAHFVVSTGPAPRTSSFR